MSQSLRLFTSNDALQLSERRAFVNACFKRLDIRAQIVVMFTGLHGSTRSLAVSSNSASVYLGSSMPLLTSLPAQF